MIALPVLGGHRGRRASIQTTDVDAAPRRSTGGSARPTRGSPSSTGSGRVVQGARPRRRLRRRQPSGDGEPPPGRPTVAPRARRRRPRASSGATAASGSRPTKGVGDAEVDRGRPARPAGRRAVRARVGPAAARAPARWSSTQALAEQRLRRRRRRSSSARRRGADPTIVGIAESTTVRDYPSPPARSARCGVDTGGTPDLAGRRRPGRRGPRCRRSTRSAPPCSRARWSSDPPPTSEIPARGPRLQAAGTRRRRHRGRRADRGDGAARGGAAGRPGVRGRRPPAVARAWR